MSRYLKFLGRGENLTWGDLAFYGATWEPFKNHGLFFVFLVAGLVDLGENPWTFRMSQILKKRCNPKMASSHGKHLLTAKSKAENFGLLALYPCYFFICCLAAPWLIFGYFWGNSLTHLMLIIASGLSIFGPKVTRRGWVSTPEWAVSFDHNGMTHLPTHPKLQKLLSPDLHPLFTKCGNPSNTENSYSLTL